MKKKSKRKYAAPKKKKRSGPRAGIKNPLKKIKTFKPNSQKSNLMRQAVVAVLWRYEHINLALLKKEVQKETATTITNNFDKYFDLVTGYLRERKLMEEMEGSKGKIFRLNQQLGI